MHNTTIQGEANKGSGLPDLVVVSPYGSFYIEAKRNSKCTLRPDKIKKDKKGKERTIKGQITCIEELKHKNFEVIIITNDNYEEFKNIIRETLKELIPIHKLMYTLYKLSHSDTSFNYKNYI